MSQTPFEVSRRTYKGTARKCIGHVDAMLTDAHSIKTARIEPACRGRYNAGLQRLAELPFSALESEHKNKALVSARS